jgi:hypothetical protein
MSGLYIVLLVAWVAVSPVIGIALGHIIYWGQR